MAEAVRDQRSATALRKPARRNVTVPLSPAVYDALVDHCASAGVSMSAAGEAIFTDALLGTDKSPTLGSLSEAAFRQIVREEIARDRELTQLAGDWYTPLPKPGDAPVQPPDRDWLRV